MDAFNTDGSRYALASTETCIKGIDNAELDLEMEDNPAIQEKLHESMESNGWRALRLSAKGKLSVFDRVESDGKLQIFLQPEADILTTARIEDKAEELLNGGPASSVADQAGAGD